MAKTLLALDGLPGEKEVRAAVSAALDSAAAHPPPGSGSPDLAQDLGAGGSSCSAAAAGAGVRTLPGGGCWLPLVGAGGEELGAALCASGGSGAGTRAGAGAQLGASRRPIFVSVGHRIGLASALAIVQRCCTHRSGV